MLENLHQEKAQMSPRLQIDDAVRSRLSTQQAINGISIWITNQRNLDNPGSPECVDHPFDQPPLPCPPRPCRPWLLGLPCSSL
jgi:hypothetical protein